MMQSDAQNAEEMGPDGQNAGLDEQQIQETLSYLQSMDIDENVL